MSRTTALTVSVSLDTIDAIKHLLEDSKFIKNMNNEGLVIKDQSHFLRLAIVLLVSSTPDQIKKNMVHSNSDSTLLSLLEKSVGVKNA
jgi:hypothetical protein